ncbi:MAG: NAD(P)-dependent oxidoreductase [Chthoniobacterales bacterium]
MSPSLILILGSGGLLGRHVVREYSCSDQPVVAFSHQDLDVTDEKTIIAVLDKIRPKVVINCAALCHFQQCEDHPKQSAQVNRDAPIRLAALTAERGIRLVHFSTDYIFDGQTETPYREEDTPHPLSVYGIHKAAVEAAFRSYPGHLLLRVAWLFGDGGRTFLSLLPDLLMHHSTLEVASGKRGSCLHVGYAAQIIRQLVSNGSSGLFNLVHSGEASWEGFAHECLRQLKERRLAPQCQNLVEIPLEKMSVLSGSRPLYSVLDVSKLAEELGFQPIDWRDGLSQFLDLNYPSQRPVLA